MMGKVLDETSRVVDNIQPDQLSNPSPCEEWTVRDVLNHVTGGATLFTACVRDGAVSDERYGELMGGDNLGDDYLGAFHHAADDAMSAFAEPGAMDKMVKLPFGEMPAGQALTIAIFDVTVHTWDLARGTGQSTELDSEVLDAAWDISHQMVSPELRATGLYGEDLDVADDLPLQDRLAAFVGRAP
jgi:uncharacterized protein (TIGR03086 family)